MEDQSFFFIEECIGPRLAREKENIGVISIPEGQATAKQIEQQFILLLVLALGSGIPGRLGRIGLS